MLMFVITAPAYAQETDNNYIESVVFYLTEDGTEAGVTFQYKSDSEQSKQARIPNIIKVAAKDGGKNKVTVYAQNFGIDAFDKISCTVEVWNASGKKYSKTNEFSSTPPSLNCIMYCRALFRPASLLSSLGESPLSSSALRDEIMLAIHNTI